VPAGLEELSGPLHALIEFLKIDEDLVEVAAQASKPLAAGPSRRELSTRSPRGRANGAFRSGWIRGILPRGAESQLSRKSVGLTPRQHECFVNVRAP
jgi:hypothetical protein